MTTKLLAVRVLPLLLSAALWHSCACRAAEPAEPAEGAEPAQSLNVTYKVDLVRSLQGGLARGGGAMEHLDVQWKADLGRLIDWQDTTAFVNFLDDRGNQFNADRVGSLLGVSNIEVPRATHRLLHAWLEKRYVDGQLGVLVGLYPVDSEFAIMESAGLFVQPPYGAWADYSLSAGPSIFNNSSFGTRLRWQGKNGTYGQWALLDGRPGHPDHPIGTQIRFGHGDGTQTVAEIGYEAEADKDELLEKVQGADQRGERYEKYMLGYWRYSTREDDLADVDDAGDPQDRRSAGWYVAAERTLLDRPGGASLAGFARYSFNDGDTLPIKQALNLGLRASGLIASRPDDLIGIAYTRAATSTKFRAAQAAAGIEATSFEDAVEITYRTQLAPWLAIQPFAQIIRHPGADTAVNDVRLLGIRFEFSF